jgi:hypothetical protein
LAAKRAKNPHKAPPMRNDSQTPQMISLDLLADLWAKSKTMSSIAQTVGVSRNKIAGAVWRARKRDDERFPQRPSIRRARPQRAPKPPPRAVRAKLIPTTPRGDRLPGVSRTALRGDDRFSLRASPIRKPKPPRPPSSSILSCATPATPGSIRFEELHWNQCRWPTNDAAAGCMMAELKFCGQPTRPGAPYCPRHTKRSAPPPRDKTT